MSDAKKRRRADPLLAMAALKQPGTMHGVLRPGAPATPPEPPVVPDAVVPDVITKPETAQVSETVLVVAESPSITAAEAASVTAAPISAPEPRPQPRKKAPKAATELIAVDELPPMVLRVHESYREPLTKAKRLLKLAGSQATLTDITQAALDYYLPLIEQHKHLVSPKK